MWKSSDDSSVSDGKLVKNKESFHTVLFFYLGARTGKLTPSAPKSALTSLRHIKAILLEQANPRNRPHIRCKNLELAFPIV